MTCNILCQPLPCSSNWVSFPRLSFLFSEVDHLLPGIQMDFATFQRCLTWPQLSVWLNQAKQTLALTEEHQLASNPTKNVKHTASCQSKRILSSKMPIGEEQGCLALLSRVLGYRLQAMASNLCWVSHNRRMIRPLIDHCSVSTQDNILRLITKRARQNARTGE